MIDHIKDYTKTSRLILNALQSGKSKPVYSLSTLDSHFTTFIENISEADLDLDALRKEWNRQTKHLLK